MFDGLLFDLDGTLWNATEIICKTWNVILKDYSEVRKEPITIKELEGCMGLPMDEIAKKLFPDTEHNIRMGLLDKCCILENEYLAREGGILFPEVEKTLEWLSRKYKLFVVSNCQVGYIESFFEGNGTGRYFTDFLSFGETELTKGENNKIIIERNNLKNAVYIGDTQGDRQSALDAGIPFVFAEYGFGNVDGYDYKIEKFSDLLNLF